MPQLDIVENYADNNVLTQQQLHQAMVSIENFINLTKLDDENIQSGAINAGLIAPEAVTTEKVAASSILLSKLATEVIQRLNPAGVILAYGGDVIPNGYLLCDGSAISRTTFSALFGAIGTRHGAGDGSTTFNLPDLRGRFIRGKDFGTARDLEASSRTAMATGGNTGDAVGSIQAQSTSIPIIPFVTGTESNDHTHTNPLFANFLGGSNAIQTNGGQYNFSTQSIPTSGRSASHTHTVVSGGDLETRPINAYENFIIKT